MLSYKHLVFWLLYFASLLFSPRCSYGQTYVFAQLSGSPMNTSGWNLKGAARVTNVTGTGDSELLLCPVDQTSGAAFFNQPINLSICSKWKAEFDFRLYDGTGADGLAFCFLDVPPSGFVIGGGLGIPATAAGLKICFDTWNNCIPFQESTVHQDMPKVEIRWGNGYNECNGQPTRTNADGAISFIRSPSYNHAKITYDRGNIQVFVNDSLMVTASQTFDFTGFLGFTASTAGYTDNESIKNVKVYTDMPPSFAGSDQAVCPGDTISIGGGYNPAYAYSWFPAAGLSDTVSSAPRLHLANDSASSEFHTYYVRTSYDSNPGCSSLDSVIVKVYPKPKINFITPEICLHDALARFTDSSFTDDNSTLPFTYLWNFGDPDASVVNPDYSTLQNPAHHYDAAAHYTVGLKVTNSEGCTDSIQKIFTVNGAVPKSAFSVLAPTVLCSNVPVGFTNQSTVDFGSITKVVFVWGDSGTDSVDENPFAGKTYAHNYPPASAATDSAFTVKLVAYSGISCEDSSVQTIKVLRAPDIHLAAIPAVCNNIAPFSIASFAAVPGFLGSFSYGGTGVSATGMFDPKQAGSGPVDLLYAFDAANGCRDTASASLTLVTAPLANAGPDLYLVKGESGTLQATASGTDLKYNWYPALYLDDPAILQPVTTPMDDINYTLTVTGNGGCRDSSSVAVKLLPEPQVPTAFTPNNDGLNDTWGIPNLSLYATCDVKVFNRFGQMVFHSTGYRQPWDGSFKGVPLPAGVYVYLIDTKRRKQLYRGTVTLIR